MCYLEVCLLESSLLKPKLYTWSSERLHRKLVAGFANLVFWVASRPDLDFLLKFRHATMLLLLLLLPLPLPLLLLQLLLLLRRRRRLLRPLLLRLLLLILQQQLLLQAGRAAG